MHGTNGKKAYVKQMFSELAPDYDRLNRIISFNSDGRWRRRAVGSLLDCQTVLDLCAGTGDMALALLSDSRFRGMVVLSDFALPMLKLARKKLAKYQSRTFIVCADAEKLPFKSGVFDGATLGFSLRNLENLPAFAGEVRRVIQTGGVGSFLEIAHPSNGLWGKLFYAYFYHLMPKMAGVFTRHRQAYRYLPESLKTFPPQTEVATLFAREGFAESRYENLWGGLAAIYKVRK
ncbi:MAG: ubiquinone/menaquinone biosynthesis methyltransferase [candidate division Zixibacteria bacterium]|nr:ubiquinone/menaquinone biosynthesis methyltransferase [candidate division Zixibacteria bacterium]MCI0596254.1 ubiquinone/menaquinone biosynthesis methyltransferase [candidate division Zixibacteria bacterium]